MKVVNVHAAKTQLSRLLVEVERGESVIIARRGRPVARLVPFLRARRSPGSLRGKIRIRDDFDEPLPEELQQLFEGQD